MNAENLCKALNEQLDEYNATLVNTSEATVKVPSHDITVQKPIFYAVTDDTIGISGKIGVRPVRVIMNIAQLDVQFASTAKRD